MAHLEKQECNVDVQLGAGPGLEADRESKDTQAEEENKLPAIQDTDFALHGVNTREHSRYNFFQYICGRSDPQSTQLHVGVWEAQACKNYGPDLEE